MRNFLRSTFFSLLVLLLAAPSFAQAVAYSGKLQIGFGDQDNASGFRKNTAIPFCAGGGALVNPGTVGTTLGTLLINAVGSGVPGVGGALTFNAVGGGHGGAQQKTTATCNIAYPGFTTPRIRSKTSVGSAHFPGRKGQFTPNIHLAPVPATPTATYMLSALAGNRHPSTVTQAHVTLDGNRYTVSGVRFSSSIALERIQPGPARFGGGIPFSGGGGTQVGLNFATTKGTPNNNVLMRGDYGFTRYKNGFIPHGPQFFGTDATGIHVVSQLTSTNYTPSSTTKTIGLLYARQDINVGARTPGGTTQHQHGAIMTTHGGNTVTPATPPGIAIVSPVGYDGFFGRWTTGKVTHYDSAGIFTTIRTAAGFDIIPTGTTKISNETRRLQVVAPWSASVRPLGIFGLPIPNLGFGGIAVMTVNIIPAPEPATLVMIWAGVIGLISVLRRTSAVP